MALDRRGSMSLLAVCLGLLVCVEWSVEATADASSRATQVRLQLIALDVQDGHPYATFTLTNSANTTVSYNGYGADDPVYELEYWNGKQWRAQMGGWCGVGLGMLELGPGRVVSFGIDLAGMRSPSRVGITIFPNSKVTSGHTVFSSKFSFSEYPMQYDDSEPLPEPPVDLIPPRLLTKVVPEYPEVARKAGIQGTVTLSCLIDAAGRVQDIKIVEPGIPLLNDSAVAAVRMWKYDPAKLKGHAVAVHTTIKVRYDLGKKRS